MLLIDVSSTFVCRKKLKKGVLLYVHLNLSVALLLAMLVFIVGVDHASFNTVSNILFFLKMLN